MKLTFHIQYRTLWGESLSVILNDDRLNIIELSTRDGIEWRGECYYTNPTEGQLITYRYCVVRDGKIIRKELEHDIDKHSKTLIATYIELLLGYCMRFYERQFITRSKSNRDVLTRFEQLLDEYFEGSAAERDGLPSVKHFADKLYLSSNYFGDMLKKETGKTPQEYIQEKIIEVAKDRISGTQDTVSQIAYSLGFQYPQHLCRLFKKRAGCTPNEYRAKMIG